jgi:hypothetical protein
VGKKPLKQGYGGVTRGVGVKMANNGGKTGDQTIGHTMKPPIRGKNRVPRRMDPPIRPPRRARHLEPPIVAPHRVTCQCPPIEPLIGSHVNAGHRPMQPLMVTGHTRGSQANAPVYSENSADFNFPLYGEKIEMDLAVDLGCRAEERHTTNNYGHTHLLDSNRQHCCYVPRTNHHINTARRRRRRRKQSQVRPMCRLQMRPGRQKRFYLAHVYWRGNSPHLSAVLALPLPLEPYTLPHCPTQLPAAIAIKRSIR